MPQALHVEPVTSAMRAEFVAYVLAHGPEHDDSFTSAEDLRAFDPVFEPAALARDETGGVVGAASLMTRGYIAEGVARFRILHALDPDACPMLVAAVTARAPARVREAYAFAPDGAEVIGTLARVGFAPSRYAIVLRRRGGKPEPDLPPAGVTIAKARSGADEKVWVEIINAAFADFLGRYDMTPQQAGTRLGDERLLPGSALIAWEGKEPVGLAAVSRHVEDGHEIASVDHLAVVPRAQGRGIGRALLRAAIRAAGEAGLLELELSTGETNERALALYRSEGFEITQRVACLTRELCREKSS